jgi:16S rRNA (guanine527-N7)-methyltransferase
MRGSFDCAVSRGVAALNVLCELCMPFVKVGGVFLAYKGRGADAEIAEAKNAVAVLGGEVERVERAEIGGAERALVFIRKVKPTHDAYPRPFAKIKKKPL